MRNLFSTSSNLLSVPPAVAESYLVFCLFWVFFFSFFSFFWVCVFGSFFWVECVFYQSPSFNCWSALWRPQPLAASPPLSFSSLQKRLRHFSLLSPRRCTPSFIASASHSLDVCLPTLSETRYPIPPARDPIFIPLGYYFLLPLYQSQRMRGPPICDLSVPPLAVRKALPSHQACFANESIIALTLSRRCCCCLSYLLRRRKPLNSPMRQFPLYAAAPLSTLFLLFFQPITYAGHACRAFPVLFPIKKFCRLAG